MFGLSFAKILLIAAVVAAVWYGFKYLTRPEKDDAEDKRARKPAPGPSSGGARAVEDMVRCPVCGAYQARNAGPCEREDCPARR